MNAACSDYPEADYYEVNGVVSIEAKSLGEQNNWRPEKYYTGRPMVSFSDTMGTAGSLTFPFFIRRPGTYHIWVLSRQADKPSDENFLPFRVMDNRDFLLEHFRLLLNEKNALEWLNKESRTGEEINVHFPEPGHYSVVFESQGTGGYMIDKLHLALNNIHKPSGTGFPETTDFRVDPVLAKREQIVVIPPAWAFGVMAGGGSNQESAEAHIRSFDELNFPLDAYWISAETDAGNQRNRKHPLELYRDSERFPDLYSFWEEMAERGTYPGFAVNGTGESLEEDISAAELQPFLEHGLSFIKFDQKTGASQVKTAFNSLQKDGAIAGRRGFVLSGVESVCDPDFKQYPAMHTGRAAAEWSQPQYPHVDSNMMGGLRENIEMVANRRLTTYEIPFLSTAVGGYNNPGQAFSEELFIRWAQFGAFNSMMHIPVDDGKRLSHLSENAKNIVGEYFQLRNRLFPYIYSQAHLVRPTGVKPVRGDGEHTTQFHLGNAFLVAPVYEEGAQTREIYLPEGTWYNYQERTVHDGDQYILAEAPIEKMPVFVKAGSIIPYRAYSSSVLSGTNEKLTIEIYAGDSGTFRLYEDDGLTTRYQQGEFSTTAFRYFEGAGYSTFTIGRVAGQYDGQPSEKELTLIFTYVDEPTMITANEEALEREEGAGRWYYDEGMRTLVIQWVQPNGQKTDFMIRE